MKPFEMKLFYPFKGCNSIQINYKKQLYYSQKPYYQGISVMKEKWNVVYKLLGSLFTMI